MKKHFKYFSPYIFLGIISGILFFSGCNEVSEDENLLEETTISYSKEEKQVIENSLITSQTNKLTLSFEKEETDSFKIKLPFSLSEGFTIKVDFFDNSGNQINLNEIILDENSSVDFQEVKLNSTIDLNNVYYYFVDPQTNSIASSEIKLLNFDLSTEKEVKNESDAIDVEYVGFSDDEIETYSEDELYESEEESSFDNTVQYIPIVVNNETTQESKTTKAWLVETDLTKINRPTIYWIYNSLVTERVKVSATIHKVTFYSRTSVFDENFQSITSNLKVVNYNYLYKITRPTNRSSNLIWKGYKNTYNSKKSYFAKRIYTTATPKSIYTDSTVYINGKMVTNIPMYLVY